MRTRIAHLEREAGADVPVADWRTRPPEKPAPPRWQPERVPVRQQRAPERPAPRPASRPAPAPRPVRPPKPKREPRSFEDVIGTKVLPFAGALAVLLGVSFLVAVAIGRGWLGETARIVLAYVASGALAAAGGWLYEKRGKTQAALAMCGTGIAAGFMTTTAAIQLYALVPAPVGLAIGFAIGAAATVYALRWNSKTVACIGIIGGLLSPVMLGTGTSDAGIAFVAIALASATGVLVWRRWEWLAMAAVAVSAPQYLAWAADSNSALEVVTVSIAFWSLYMFAALGYELRRPGVAPRPSALVLAVVAPLVAAAGGYWSLREMGYSSAGDWLIAGLGVAHVLLALASRRSKLTSPEVRRLLMAGGFTMGNTAFGLIANGPTVAIGFAASAAALGVFARRGKVDTDFAAAVLGVQLCLSLAHTLLFDAPPERTLEQLGGGPNGAALASLLALAVAAFVCARLCTGSKVARISFDTLAIAALAYSPAFALEGAALTAAWAGQAVVLARIAEHSRDQLARIGSLSFLSIALVHTLAVEANPTVFSSGDELAAVAGLLAFALGAFACTRLMDPDEGDRVVLGALAATALAYAVPIAVDGPGIVGAWAGGAVLFAAAARLTGGADRVVARVASPAWLMLAASVALATEAAPARLGTHGWISWQAPLALAIIALAAVLCERLARASDPTRPSLRAAAIAAVLYLLPWLLDDGLLVAALSAAAVVLAYGWLRTRDAEAVAVGSQDLRLGALAVRGDLVLAGGAIAAIAVAVLHALSLEAPPSALVDGPASNWEAAIAFVAIAAAALFASRSLPRRMANVDVRLVLESAGAGAALYGASVLIVGAFPPALDSELTGIGVGQQGQMLLSAFWAGTGLVALVWGLLHDERSRRIAGLGLLSLALGKVFLYDLATLDSIYRVVSFVALGVLLLVGAFAYQRVRPEEVRN